MASGTAASAHSGTPRVPTPYALAVLPINTAASRCPSTAPAMQPAAAGIMAWKTYAADTWPG